MYVIRFTNGLTKNKEANCMDTKKVKALITAVDRGSLTAAATELGYTQSGLTHMMNSLEVECGLTLLVRSKNGVRLSPAGQELLPKMRALIHSAEEFERGAEQLKKKSFSSLRLGAYSSVAKQWLPSIVSEFRRVSPGTEVTIDVNGITKLYDAIKQDDLDCAIVSFQEPLSAGLCWFSLRDDEIVAILPKSFNCEGDVFPIEQFDGTEFLMPSANFDMDINPLFNTGSVKVSPRISYTNLGDEAIVSMVKHGLGVSILTDLVMQGINTDVRMLSISPPAFRSLGIITTERRKNDKNIKRFVKCAQAVMLQMYG